MASTIANTVLTKIGALVSSSYPQREQSDLQQNSHLETPTLNARLALLVAEHADLDVAICALLEAGKCDDLLITRLKKRKLQIKDEISSIAPSSNNDDGTMMPQEMISCVA
jgi:hypothetical protein